MNNREIKDTYHDRARIASEHSRARRNAKIEKNLRELRAMGYDDIKVDYVSKKKHKNLKNQIPGKNSRITINNYLEFCEDYDY